MTLTLNWITDSVAGQVPAASPDLPALAFEDQTPITYGELCEGELRYATALQKAGVKPGDRVAIPMRNCIEYPQLFHAISRAGEVSVRLNWRLTGPELQFLLEDSGSTLLILDGEFVERIDSVRDHIPVTSFVVRTEDGRPAPAGSLSLDEFGNVEAIGTFSEPSSDDAATIMYTARRR
jgi:fatty-acyl-CoA synthase